MLTQDLAVGIESLIHVARLREVSCLVVTKSKATCKRHIGNTLEVRAVPGRNPKARICWIAETLACWNCSTRILHQIGARWRQQLALSVPVIDKPCLVAGLCRNRPDVRQVQLLEAVPS